MLRPLMSINLCNYFVLLSFNGSSSLLEDLSSDAFPVARRVAAKGEVYFRFAGSETLRLVVVMRVQGTDCCGVWRPLILTTHFECQQKMDCD
jgi:hypothetical protein